MYYIDIYVHVQYHVHVVHVHVHVIHVVHVHVHTCSYKMAIVHNKNNTRNVLFRHICTCAVQCTCSTCTRTTCKLQNGNCTLQKQHSECII